MLARNRQPSSTLMPLRASTGVVQLPPSWVRSQVWRRPRASPRAEGPRSGGGRSYQARSQASSSISARSGRSQASSAWGRSARKTRAMSGATKSRSRACSTVFGVVLASWSWTRSARRADQAARPTLPPEAPLARKTGTGSSAASARRAGSAASASLAQTSPVSATGPGPKMHSITSAVHTAALIPPPWAPTRTTGWAARPGSASTYCCQAWPMVGAGSGAGFTLARRMSW